MLAADKRASLLRPNVDGVAGEKVLSSRRRRLIKVGQIGGEKTTRPSSVEMKTPPLIKINST